MMTADRCLRDELAAIFRAQKLKADAILEMLGREREGLLAGDLSVLETVAREKTALMDELEQMRAQEFRLLERKGTEYFFQRRTRTPDQADQVRSIRSAHRDAVDAIAECQALNARNGLLLQHRIGYVRRALQALGGADGNAGLYGADGRIESPSGLRCVARG